MNAQTKHIPGNCYVCGKSLKANAHWVFLEDDDNRAVLVGGDCYRRVVKAGYDGVKSKDGPRVFVEQRFASHWPVYSAAIAKATGEQP